MQLNLSYLKSAQAGAESLAVDEDRARTVSDFIQTVSRIYSKLQEESQTEGTGK